jgi:ribonuclease D
MKVKGLRRRRDTDFERRVNEMLSVRDKKAAELDIEASLIASRAVIETIAAEEGDNEGLLMKWQKECLGMA